MADKKPWLFFAEIRSLPAGESPRGLFRYLPPASRAELLLGAALIVASLLGGWWALQRRADALAFEHDAVIVEGKVVRLWVTHGKGAHHRVAYEYPAAPEAEGRVLAGEDEIPEKDFPRLKVGGPIAVRVCRTDPVNHVVQGGRPRAFSGPAALPAALGILALLFVAGVINLGWWLTCRWGAGQLRKTVIVRSLWAARPR